MIFKNLQVGLFYFSTYYTLLSTKKIPSYDSSVTHRRFTQIDAVFCLCFTPYVKKFTKYFFVSSV